MIALLAAATPHPDTAQSMALIAVIFGVIAAIWCAIEKQFSSVVLSLCLTFIAAAIYFLA